MRDGDNGSNRGSLVIIGGNEDRENQMEVLKRFVALSGGPEATIAVVTSASEIPGDVWPMYETAFRQLGVTALFHVHLDARHEADNPKLLRCVAQANGIFMTGGDQKRLLEMTGETKVHAEIARAYRERGACIAGTSAGASAMSRFMLAQGNAELEPEKGAMRLASGLGLVEQIVVDQHFAERQRLPRLLSIISERPDLYGVGIDEDTAIVVLPTGGIEVIGQGAVTVVDGMSMSSNAGDVKPGETPLLVDVRLHVLPSGTRLRSDAATDNTDAAEATPGPLQLFLSTVTQ